MPRGDLSVREQLRWRPCRNSREMVRKEELLHIDPDSPDHVSLSTTAEQRVLIVGDVHGCFDELQDLLQLHQQRDDIVILAGDLVTPFVSVCL